METEEMNNMGVIADVQVKMTAIAGKTSLSLKQLHELQEGTVLELDSSVGSEIELCVNGTAVAKGQLVLADNDELGVCITEILLDGVK